MLIMCSDYLNFLPVDGYDITPHNSFKHSDSITFSFASLQVQELSGTNLNLRNELEGDFLFPAYFVIVKMYGCKSHFTLLSVFFSNLMFRETELIHTGFFFVTELL